MSDNDIAIKVENLSKYYYSSTSVTCALRKINLEFKVGESVIREEKDEHI